MQFTINWGSLNVSLYDWEVGLKLYLSIFLLTTLSTKNSIYSTSSYMYVHICICTRAQHILYEMQKIFNKLILLFKGTIFFSIFFERKKNIIVNITLFPFKTVILNFFVET